MPWGPTSLRKPQGSGAAGPVWQALVSQTSVWLLQAGPICLGGLHRSQPRVPPIFRLAPGMSRAREDLGAEGQGGVVVASSGEQFPPPAPRQEITPSAGTEARDRFRSSWRVFLHIWSRVPFGPEGAA